MTTLDEMWAALETHQPIADRKGYGEQWERMCTERTEKAARYAYAAARYAYAAAAAAAAAAAVAVAVAVAVAIAVAVAAAAGDAEEAVNAAADADAWAKKAVEYITRANEGAAK